MPVPTLPTDEDLRDLAALEERVVAADAGRLKLEWRVLREGRTEVVLHREDGVLRGAVGLYSWSTEVELVGAVDPAARGTGLGGALLDVALERCRERDAPAVLLVVPAGGAAGAALARSRGGTPHHAEHALVLTARPEGREDPRTRLRPAGAEDAPLVARLLEAGFGVPLSGAWPDTLLVEVDGEPVGTLRVTRDGTTASVHAFVVDPAHQGRGIGRDVLGRVCRTALGAGAERVALEVAVENPGALRLYTATGFVPVAGEDYWALPLPSPAER